MKVELYDIRYIKILTQQTFTFSKSTVEKLEKGVKYTKS